MTRRRILLLYVAFLGLLLATTYVVLRESGVSHKFVEGVLARFLVRERFSLENANVDLGDGTVTLEGLQLKSASESGGTTQVDVRRVEVGLDTNPLGRVGAVRTITIKGLHLTLDLTKGRVPDLSEFLRRTDLGSRSGTEQAPPIRIEESTISLQISPGAPAVDFRDVNLQLLPVEPGSSRVVLSGRMTAPTGIPVVVTGTGDVRTPEFRGQLELLNIPLRPDIAGPYSSQVVDYLAQVGIKGSARKLTVWIEYPGARIAGAATDEVAAGVDIDLADVTCKVPQMPYPLVGASARISANTMQNGTVKLVVENRSVDGDLVARGTLTNCFSGAPLIDVAATAQGVLVGPALREAVRVQHEARTAWDAFEPSGGRADAEFRLRNETPGGSPVASLDLDLRGVSASFRGFPNRNGTPPFGFPHPLTDIHGRIQLRPGAVFVQGVTARLGASAIEVEGSVTRGESQDEPDIGIDIRSDDLEMTETIRESLGVLLPTAQEVWDEYAPAGHTALRVGLRIGPRFDVPGAFVTLKPLGCSATYAGFPCRVDRIRGTIDIEPLGVTFALDGQRGASPVTINGRFMIGTAGTDGTEELHGTSSELWLSAKRIASDDELRAALRTLDEDIGRACDYVGFDGTTDCELSLWRSAGSREFGYDVRVDVRDGSARLQDLQVPMRRLTGPLFVHGSGSRSRVDVSAIRGEIANAPGVQPATLLVQGTVQTDPLGFAMDITSIVRHLQLTDELAVAMDQNGAFDLDAWRVLRPSGFVDAISRLTRSADAPEIDHELRLQLRDVTCSAAILPAPATGLHGQVSVKDGVAKFEDVRGEMAGSRIYCSEGMAASSATETRFRATVTSEEFPVDERMANLMTGPLRETYLARDVQGAVAIKQLDLDVHWPAGRNTFVSTFSGRFTARNLAMTLGTRIVDVSGTWTIDEGRVDGNDGHVVGGVENGALTMFNHRATGLSGRFEVSPDLVVVSHIDGRVHNGRLFGAGEDGADLSYSLEPPGVLSFDLRWESVSLQLLLRAAGLLDDRYRGNLSGAFHLAELRGGDLVDVKGRGHLAIQNGRLGEVPIFTAIYSFLSPHRRPQFESVRTELIVENRRIVIHDLEANSPLLRATGGGTVDMDGYVSMLIDFPDFFSRAADWLILPRVLHFLTTRVVQFEIFGFLRAPQARPRWLWSDPPPRLPIGPIPAARPRR